MKNENIFLETGSHIWHLVVGGLGDLDKVLQNKKDGEHELNYSFGKES